MDKLTRPVIAALAPAAAGKHWGTGPDGQRWQNYVVLADAHPELEAKTPADIRRPRKTPAAAAPPRTPRARVHRLLRTLTGSPTPLPRKVEAEEGRGRAASEPTALSADHRPVSK